MLLTTRQKRILELVSRDGLRVDELSEMLEVSEATVRRDLRRLSSEGMLNRVRGGATSQTDPPAFWPEVAERQRQNAAEKQRIGKAAAQLVSDNSTIIVDAGSTTRQVIPHLLGKQAVTVITRDLDIAVAVLQIPGLELVVMGGSINPRNRASAGALAVDLLRHYYADQCFMGGISFSPERGLMTASAEEAEVKREILRRSRERICLLDQSKLGRGAGALVAPTSDLHRLITDSRVEPGTIAHFEEHGVQVMPA